MLKHFADCPEQYLSCTMCIQMFSFVCMHAYDCRKNRYACQIALCVKFHHVLRDDTIENQVKRLWRIIKKKLACVLGFDDGIMTSTSFVPINPPTHHSIGIGAMHHSHTSLASIPENSEGRTSRPGSQVLTRKRSNKLPSVPESEALAWGSGHVELSDTVPLPDTTRLSDTARLSDTRRLSDSTRLADTMRSDTTRLADTMRSDTTRLPDTMTAEMPDKTRVADTIAAPVPMPTVPAKHPMVRKISASRFVSLPVGGGTEGQQFPSYTFQPVGRPGICKYIETDQQTF